jgi:hypothetical protein
MPASFVLGIAKADQPGPSRALDTANELLLRAFELNPTDAETLTTLGTVKLESGSALAAARFYRAALLVAL